MNDLVREHPDLVIRILREQDGVELPDGGMIRVESGELNDRIFTNRQADTSARASRALRVDVTESGGTDLRRSRQIVERLDQVQALVGYVRPKAQLPNRHPAEVRCRA